jgi:catechol 2,3-dioxygenase-like lactoylglutathione lyase family enzyme
MYAQPLIAVRDVQASSRWYQAVLGCESGHGGLDYERIIHKGRLILQLHQWDAHEHPHIGNQDLKPYGNGVVLWFETDEFDKAVERAIALHAEMIQEPGVNPNANHREVWFRDTDGYIVVVASTSDS